MEIRALSKLQQLAAPRFRLKPFELVPLEFDEDELLLEDVVAQAESNSNVVPIFADTAVDPRTCVERRRDAEGEQRQQPRSASDELAEALAELRRSLR